MITVTVRKTETGEEVTLPLAEANRLVWAGHAERVAKPKRAKKPTVDPVAGDAEQT